MKKLICFILASVAAFFCSVNADAKTDKSIEAFRYDVEYIKTAGTGISDVMVWAYSNKKKESEDLIRKAAVHAVIFKGYAGGGARKPALARDPQTATTHQVFFHDFFNRTEEYGRFVSSVGSVETRKLSKGFKHGAVVSVDVNSLRKYLEQRGIIKSMSSGF